MNLMEFHPQIDQWRIMIIFLQHNGVERINGQKMQMANQIEGIQEEVHL